MDIVILGWWWWAAQLAYNFVTWELDLALPFLILSRRKEHHHHHSSLLPPSAKRRKTVAWLVRYLSVPSLGRLISQRCEPSPMKNWARYVYLGGPKKVPEEGCYLFLHPNNNNNDTSSVINCFYATRPVCPESQENWYIYFDFSSSNSAAGWRWSLFFCWPFFWRREPGAADRIGRCTLSGSSSSFLGHNEWMYRLIKAPFRSSYPWLRLMPKRRVARRLWSGP